MVARKVAMVGGVVAAAGALAGCGSSPAHGPSAAKKTAPAAPAPASASPAVSATPLAMLPADPCGLVPQATLNQLAPGLHLAIHAGSRDFIYNCSWLSVSHAGSLSLAVAVHRDDPHAAYLRGLSASRGTIKESRAVTGIGDEATVKVEAGAGGGPGTAFVDARRSNVTLSVSFIAAEPIDQQEAGAETVARTVFANLW